MIVLKDAKKLISLARNSIAARLKNKTVNHDSELKKKFSEKQGVFVTLKKKGELRGCIGFPEPVFALYDAIISAAESAAFQDPRFYPVEQKEFENITVELSILTVPQLLKIKKPEEYLDKIVIGKHGLIIRSKKGSGLLLPQVFTEYNCTPLSALEMTCQKANLAPGAWKNKDCKLYTFSAQIFKEETPKGDIIEE